MTHTHASPPIELMFILVILCGTVTGYLAFGIQPAYDAQYSITLGPPFRTDGFERVVTFESLTPAEQEIFIAAYRIGEPDDRSTLVWAVDWNNRLTAPPHRFLSIKYVEYRDRYYPVTATVTKDATVSELFRQLCLYISGFCTLFFGLSFLAMIWETRLHRQCE
jgi:hypothetical protein